MPPVQIRLECHDGEFVEEITVYGIPNPPPRAIEWNDRLFAHFKEMTYREIIYPETNEKKWSIN